MRPVFADPKTDFVFKKLFGTEAHKGLLIALLNSLLGRKGDHAIQEVTFLTEEQRPKVEELKFSIVDAKCRDASGALFVVEMQILKVEGFEKRVVYNASKAYVNQLDRGEDYPALNDIFAISICDFALWPDAEGEPKVPLVSHWRLQEQQGGRRGLSQVQYVFVELPKLSLEREPGEETEEWAYVFKQAPLLSEVPSFLHAEGPREALDVARTAHFTAEEWEAYDRAKVAEQDARGALTFAKKEGVAEGKKEGLAEGEAKGKKEGLAEGEAKGKKEGLAEGEAKGKREAVLAIVTARGLPLSATQRTVISTCLDLAQLDLWIARATSVSSVEALLAQPTPAA